MRREVAKANRQEIIQELRHQLRYSQTHDREGIRRELDFWLNYR